MFWKIRYGKYTSPGVSGKLPLTLCLKHVRLQTTKWLFQNTWVLLHVEAEAEIESNDVTHSASQLAYRRGLPAMRHVSLSFSPHGPN